MPLREKSSEEILLEQLAIQVQKLSAEAKAKEAACKELNSQILILERNYQEKEALLQANYEAKKAALEQAVAPLVQAKDTVSQLLSEVARLTQARADAIAELKSSKNLEIHEANRKVTEATHRHQSILAAIDDAKTKVAAL